MGIALIVIYVLCMLYVMAFSLVQLHLAILYSTHKKHPTTLPNDMSQNWPDKPFVTIQLPVFNERYVIERLMDAVSAFEWPKNKMEVQVLDDSDDETLDIIARKKDELCQKGFEVSHIRRTNRKGYKAGALSNGLQMARGNLIAIFDADFIPSPDFLIRTVPSLIDPQIGMVQTKWGHLNKNYSLLTRLQAFGLDGHFSVEQSGRSFAGSFINFNGTAGIWRKSCILDAGGWQDDTIAEDLDLSYRAQMKGWKFKYIEHVNAPAELPVVMSAVKTQQFRWNKGGAESARKNLLKVMKSRLGLENKLHAFFHLTNSTNFLFILIASVVSIPLLYTKSNHPDLKVLFDISSIFILGFAAISYFYWIATKYNNTDARWTYIKYYPLFLAFSMGLAFHNSVAVVEGLFGKKTPFERTPKFNIVDLEGQWRHSNYIKTGISAITIAEGFLSLYFVSGIAIGFVVRDYGLMIFHLMLAVGYAFVFYYSVRK